MIATVLFAVNLTIYSAIHLPMERAKAHHAHEHTPEHGDEAR
jgi:hypothetical protein